LRPENGAFERIVRPSDARFSPNASAADEEWLAVMLAWMQGPRRSSVTHALIAIDTVTFQRLGWRR